MKRLRFVLLVTMAHTCLASQILVQLVNTGAVQPQPNFFTFSINGVTANLLCDQLFPNVTSSPYTAMVASLSDLTGTALVRAGDPNSLQKYQWIAILDLQAYNNNALAPDVTRANRYIVDGSGAMTAQSTALLNFAQSQNPANYDLSGFNIYVGVRPDGSILETQEQTGFTPEPGSLFSMAGGLLLLTIPAGRRYCVRKLRQRALPS